MNKQEIRRAVIRESMALPCDKRQTEGQTALPQTQRSASAQPQWRVSGDDRLVAATDVQALTCARHSAR